MRAASRTSIGLGKREDAAEAQVESESSASPASSGRR